MVNFVYSRKNADAEEVLENINKTIILGSDRYELEVLEGFRDSIMADYEKNLQKVDTGWEISVYKPLISSNKIKLFLKRVTRKLIAWLLLDIADQQMEFNRAVVDCVNSQNNIKQILVKENKQLKLLLEKQSKEIKNEK